MKYASSGRKTKWLRRIIMTFVFGAILLLGAVIGVREYYSSNLRPVSGDTATKEVVIPVGSSLSDIAAILKEEAVIRNKRVFESYVRSKGSSEDIKAGTYELSPSYSVQEVTAIITEGRISSDLLRIPSEARIDEIRKKFIAAGYSASEVEEAFNPQKYASHPALVDKPVEASLEGYLYPESFQRTAETTAEQIVTKSLDEMQKHLTPDIREAFSTQGLSVYKAITLASIIEKEVPLPQDRAQVAQIFLKRISIGMKLQSDATARYGAVLDGQEPSIRYSSPYNTYENAGLPPSPISNVTESSLRAVAYPAQTDWLFFVSGDDGKTHFSHTLEEHEAKAKQYCTTQCGN